MPHNAFRKQASALENECFQEVREELTIELYQLSAANGAEDSVAKVTGINARKVPDELQSVTIYGPRKERKNNDEYFNE